MKNAITILLLIAAAMTAGCQNTYGPDTVELGPVEPPEDIMAAYDAPGPALPPAPGGLFGPPAPSATQIQAQASASVQPTALAAPPAPVEPIAAPVVEPVAAPIVKVAAPQPVAPAPAVSPTRVHVVTSGQTLWRISGMYYGKASRANVEKIVAANPSLSDANTIFVGQKIVIPD